MKHLPTGVALAVFFFALHPAARAEITFAIAPTQCSAPVGNFQCTLILPPANALGIYPTLRFTDDLVNDSGGLVDWSTALGPAGKYLGAGVIQRNAAGHYLSYPVWSRVCSGTSCSEQVTSLTVYFDGTYIGGGTYAGLYTLHMSYAYKYTFRGGWRWVRTITGGLVTLTQ